MNKTEEFLTSFLNRHGVVCDSSTVNRKHHDGTPCHAKKLENCPEYKKDVENDTLSVNPSIRNKEDESSGIDDDAKCIQIALELSRKTGEYWKQQLEDRISDGTVPKHRIPWIEEAAEKYGWDAAFRAIPSKNRDDVFGSEFRGGGYVMPTAGKNVSSMFGSKTYTDSKLKHEYLEIARTSALAIGKWHVKMSEKADKVKSVSEQYPVGMLVRMKNGEICKIRGYDKYGNAGVLFPDGADIWSCLDIVGKATKSEMEQWGKERAKWRGKDEEDDGGVLSLDEILSDYLNAFM